MRSALFACALAAMLITLTCPAEGIEMSSSSFKGLHYSGAGDTDYLELLDTARRFFDPDPELPNITMLYTPQWNGLVEGPTWGAWWIQNSYGPSYCAMPFLEEPLVTFLQNSQDLWFDQMGDGVRVGGNDWVAPDGCLCDAASPNWIFYKQGDGRTDIHDWGMEFTAAGIVLQSELLLIGRDRAAIDHYLPKLERCAAFIETRRDPENNLFLAGPAGNLLAPSYAGWAREDGTFDKAYLVGLSVTYIAALDRLIELEKLAGRSYVADVMERRRATAREGLKQVTTEEGYLIRSLDPDGTKHGVFGAEKHGYFEVSPNQDALCFRVIDDSQAQQVYAKIQSIPELRPHNLILPNYPGYDDMYVDPTGNWLWEYGTWVNGGHWSTCEARMVMAYFRMGDYDSARRSMETMLKFGQAFRFDNPLVDRGAAVYQPNQPINVVYDSFGPPAAMVRGLFEYVYRADDLTLIPHIPPGITELRQHDPIRFGAKRLYLSTAGAGPVTSVTINGRSVDTFDGASVRLAYDTCPSEAVVAIGLGGAIPRVTRPHVEAAQAPESSDPRAAALVALITALDQAGLGDSHEAGHARLALGALQAIELRRDGLASGAIPALAEESRSAADGAYVMASDRLLQGLVATLKQTPELAAMASELMAESAWLCTRALGSEQTFRPTEQGWLMALDAADTASCGWTVELAEPVNVRPGDALSVTLNGSEGAEFFLELTSSSQAPAVTSGWRPSPGAEETIRLELPAEGAYDRLTLYTQTAGGEVTNLFRDARIITAERPDGLALLALPPTE